jgi:hypothetical protein
MMGGISMEFNHVVSSRREITTFFTIDYINIKDFSFMESKVEELFNSKDSLNYLYFRCY